MHPLSGPARWSSLDTGRMHRLAKEGGWVVAGQISSVLGALVLVRVLTEYLTPSQYGELALGLTAAGLVNQMLMGGLNAGIGRFYAVAAEQQDLRGFLRSSRRLIGYATVVVVAIALVLMAGLSLSGYSHWVALATAALLYSILSGYNASLGGIQNAARQRAIVAFHSGLDAWLKILLVVGGMLWLGSGSTIIVIGYALSALLVTGSQLLFMRRVVMPEPRHAPVIDWARQILAYSWPFSIFGFFTWLHQASDRWILQKYSTTDEVGLYAVVFQLGYMPIGVLIGMTMNFLAPILYQRSGDAKNSMRNADVHRMAWAITWACFGVTAAVVVLTLLLHEWIFGVLVAAEYQSYSYLLPWMTMAGGVFAAGQMLSLKLMADMKTVDLLLVKVTTAILGVAMNIYGVSYFGVDGLVVAQVMFSWVFFMWLMWLAQHRPVLVPNV